IGPHPEIVEARKRLNFDYGKFDYVLHEGRPVLLDTNKTTGADRGSSRELNARRRAHSTGLPRLPSMVGITTSAPRSGSNAAISRSISFGVTCGMSPSVTIAP